MNLSIEGEERTVVIGAAGGNSGEVYRWEDVCTLGWDLVHFLS